MKKIKFLSLIAVIMLLITMMVGCGAASDKAEVGATNGFKGDVSFDEMTQEDVEMGDSINGSSSSSSDAPAEIPNPAQKLVYTYTYSTESLDFDKSISELETAIKDSKGYVESSNIYGNKYSGQNSRRAEYTIRIPTNTSNKFIDFIDNNSIVTQKEIDTKDVTMQYVDIESRLSALRTQKSALEKLLSQATNVNDIISVQRQLSNVIYEIESYEARLRTLSNLVDYTTIHLTIREVKTPTIMEEPTFWEELTQKFKDNFAGSINFFKGLFMFLVTSIPQFVVILIFVLPTALFTKRFLKKRRLRKQACVAHADTTKAVNHLTEHSPSEAATTKNEEKKNNK